MDFERLPQEIADIIIMILLTEKNMNMNKEIINYFEESKDCYEP